MLSATLITPLKNERVGIENLFNAVCAQTHQPDAWIIADNGSTDGTAEWLEAQAGKAAFPITVLHYPKGTIAKMMNQAIERADTALIACCHGGTELSDNWLEELLKPFEEDANTGASFGLWKAVGRNPVEREIARVTRSPLETEPRATYLAASRSIAFRKAVAAQVGGFPEWLPLFGEDTLFAIRLRASGCKIVVAEKAVVGWRPQGTWAKFVRQQRLYSESDGLMRMPVRSRLRSSLRVALMLGVVFAVIATGGGIAGLLVFVGLVLGDYLRACLRTRHTLHGYVLWFWIVPLAKTYGYAKGWFTAMSGRYIMPDRDKIALRMYFDRS
jgi:glycosyltransferase involved in cell wall biosynthesis